MSECIFCSVGERNEPHHEIWWSDDFHIAFLDATPTQRGHTLLIPKKHTDNILDLTANEYVDLMLASKTVAELMRAHFKVPKIAMIVEGNSVDHVHVHLIPIGGKGELGEFPRYQLQPGEMSVLAEELRGQ